MGLAARRFLSPLPDARPIDVRVVIPARDEAATVGRLRGVGGRAGHRGGRRRRRLLRRRPRRWRPLPAARVVTLAGDPPPGWLGKPRACAAGAAGAGTEWLAFVDADVTLHPSALATMAAATRSTSTSIAGGLDCGSFWERLLLPELGLALAQEGLPRGFASGQCFLVRRDHYEAVGGHGHPAVRGRWWTTAT